MKANRKLLGDCVFKHRQAGYSPLLTSGNSLLKSPPPFVPFTSKAEENKDATVKSKVIIY